jgi:hypothetical protein
MIKFNRLPPRTSEDVELSHYTRRELFATLHFHERHLPDHSISDEMDTGSHFKVNGSEVGTTICANLSGMEASARIRLTTELAVAALVKSFDGLDPRLIQLYSDGARIGAESEILGEQTGQLEGSL